MNQQDPNPSSRQGHEACPQLAAQSVEILLADGISKSISVTGVNLPAENKVSLSQMFNNTIIFYWIYSSVVGGLL